jgi:hypothetical protein
MVNNRFETGDAQPTDVIEAQTSQTRAEQQYNGTIYEYQTAVARLEYAVGAPIAAPGTPAEEVPAPAPTTTTSPQTRPKPKPPIPKHRKPDPHRENRGHQSRSCPFHCRRAVLTRFGRFCPLRPPANRRRQGRCLPLQRPAWPVLRTPRRPPAGAHERRFSP